MLVVAVVVTAVFLVLLLVLLLVEWLKSCPREWRLDGPGDLVQVALAVWTG